MPSKVAGIGNDAVEDATGHGWDHWLAALDDRRAGEIGPWETVAGLSDRGVDSGWWRRTIANGYEVERGTRERG